VGLSGCACVSKRDMEGLRQSLTLVLRDHFAPDKSGEGAVSGPYGYSALSRA
jgi:hypothetical protein